MIAYIKGTIQGKGRNYAVVLAGGLGYKVYLNDAALAEAEVGQAVE